MKHIHILGICGTFMAGVARIAHALGYKVTGSDSKAYPPMDAQLEQCGIKVMSGYDARHLQPAPDELIIGNALSRGNPALEYALDRRLPYCSGPAWLYQKVLRDRHVLAVSGTHGKTTTTAILAWILEAAGYQPGFLVGGVAENFNVSARLGAPEYFVIEADEYDTAFFDKRSKFIHYAPATLIINNIEFDHADIFADIVAIRREFHHLVRILPGRARVIYKADDAEIQKVLAAGCWSEMINFGSHNAAWRVERSDRDYQHFSVSEDGKKRGDVAWSLIGEHNANNALAAVIAANHIGISSERACAALTGFKSVKRRLERIFKGGGISLYDDFAHHPTAIAMTLKALRQNVGAARIIAIMEPCSNTMKMGFHAAQLAASMAEADEVLIRQADDVEWDIAGNMRALSERCCVFQDIAPIVARVEKIKRNGDHIIIMSNGSFGGIHNKLIEVLS